MPGVGRLAPVNGLDTADTSVERAAKVRAGEAGRARFRRNVPSTIRLPCGDLPEIMSVQRSARIPDQVPASRRTTVSVSAAQPRAASASSTKPQV
ncbi:hypothetical protein GCM10023108_11010 [Saccharopolyspora hordei]